MKTIIIFLIIFLSINIYAQNVMWTDVRGGQWDDYGNQCFQTIDNNFIIISFKRVSPTFVCTYVLKYDFYGNLIWEKNFGENEFSNVASMAVQDKSGNFYMPVNRDSICLYKLDSDFNVIWKKNLPDNILGVGGISFTTDSNFLMIRANINNPGSFFPKYGFVKLDTSGNLIWSKGISDTIYFGSNYQSFLIDEDAYYILGRQGGIEPSKPKIFKFDNSGNFIWSKTYQLRYHESFWHGIRIRHNKYILTGMSVNQIKAITFTMCLDSSGTVLWDKQYDQDSISMGYSICKINSNNYAIVGGGYYGKCYILTIDSTGNEIQLKKHLYQPENLIAYEWISPVSDSSYIITGWFQIDDPHQYVDVLTLKTDKYGNILPIGIGKIQDKIPSGFTVNIYPNPFNPKTTIKLRSSRNTNIEIKIYNINGQLILNSNYIIKSGENIIHLDFGKYNISSGIYFLKIYEEKFSICKRLIYLK